MVMKFLVLHPMKMVLMPNYYFIQKYTDLHRCSLTKKASIILTLLKEQLKNQLRANILVGFKS